MSVGDRLMRFFPASGQSRNVLRLATGTALAQALAIAATPIITRLYPPATYANLALFTAISAIVLSVATGKFDTAVPLPPETQSGEREALQLTALASLVSTAVAALCLGVVFFGRLFGLELWSSELGGWAYALPLTIWLAALAQVLFMYANRQREYSRVASVAPISRFVVSAMQICLGFMGAGRAGLLMPASIAPAIGSAVLFRVLARGITASCCTGADLLPRRLWAVAKAFRDFPMIATWIGLLNALNFSVQILILSALYPSAVVGQYSLAMSLVVLPTSLIATSISTVYYRELAARADDVAAATALTLKTAKTSMAIGTPLMLLMGAFSIPMFPIVFGQEWSDSGYFAVALLPWMWVRFTGIILSGALTVYRRQSWQLMWQVAILALFVSSYLGGHALGLSAVACTWIASLLAVPVYLCLIPMTLKAIRNQAHGQSTRPQPAV